MFRNIIIKENSELYNAVDKYKYNTIQNPFIAIGYILVTTDI